MHAKGDLLHACTHFEVLQQPFNDLALFLISERNPVDYQEHTQGGVRVRVQGFALEIVG